MTMSPESVNTWTQPAMFGRSAVAVSMHALVDPDDQTIVFVVEAREAPGERLRALWSSSPVPFDRDIEKIRQAFKEFNTMLSDACSPFPTRS